MVLPIQLSGKQAKLQMAVNRFVSVKDSEVAAIQNKDYDNRLFFNTRGIAHHDFVWQRQTVNT
jgi:hypothetical protein